MKAIVVYASRTGKCQQMAEAITEAMKEEGASVDLYPAAMVEAKYLLDYDLILMGSSTYGDGEMLSEMVPLCETMNDIDLSGKRAAAFGCGSKRYPMFCSAVNLLESRLIDCGASLAADGYKIDGPVMFDLDYVGDWARKFVR